MRGNSGIDDLTIQLDCQIPWEQIGKGTKGGLLITWQKYSFADDDDAELFADDDDAELLLQDARWQPEQVLCLQGRDKIKLLKDLS